MCELELEAIERSGELARYTARLSNYDAFSGVCAAAFALGITVLFAVNTLTEEALPPVMKVYLFILGVAYTGLGALGYVLTASVRKDVSKRLVSLQRELKRAELEHARLLATGALELPNSAERKRSWIARLLSWFRR